MQRFITSGALMSASFGKGKLKVIGIEIQEDGPLVNTALDQIAGLFPDLSARIIGIGHGDDIRAPRSNDTLKPGDRAYIGVLDTHADRLNDIFNRTSRDMRHVVIVGGGNVGLYVASKLEQNRSIRVRLIESNAERADYAVSQLKRTIVIHGDGLDPDILEEAGVETANFIISITADDKTNLLICNLAKRAGTEKALALVNSQDLAVLSRDMRVDTVLDPRALTVSQILLRLRRGRILALQSIEDGKAEIAEGVTLEKSPLIGRAIDYDDLPDGITAAAIIRNEKVLFPGRGVTVQPEDRVVLFFEGHMTDKVEKFFRVSADFF